jgi:Chlamydia polymorphic membrane protein (Chlamydia_PMP) repeat
MRHKAFLENAFYLLLTIGLLMCSILPLSAHAAGLVTDCSTYGTTATPGVYVPGTLGAALVGGGTVTFACSGTIVVPGITLDADTTIDATGQTVTLSGNNANYVLRIWETRKVDLINLTITQGSWSGVRNYGSTVTLTNCTVSGNTSNVGGGIYNTNWQGSAATMRLIDTEVSDNSASNTGGGIYHESGTMRLIRSTVSSNSAGASGGGIVGGTMILTDSTVSNNSAASAGGIFNLGQLTLIHSTVSGNRATGAVNGGVGGGISIYGSAYAYDDKLTTITSSVVSGNSATAVGGGIYFTNGSGTVTITDSTVSNNTAVSCGGIANLGARMSITNSTISGNTAGGVGGGIDNFVGSGDTPQLTITNSTISGNTAGTQGGGIYNYAPLTLTHVTFSGNSASQGSSLYVANNSVAATNLTNTLIASSSTVGNCVDAINLITDNGYNLSSDGTCHLTATTSLPNTDPNLGLLADNGGLTQTHALLAGSPAVDRIPHGINGCGTTITTDQRGAARPQGSGCDIGTYEVGFLGDINRDGVVDISDVILVLRIALGIDPVTPCSDINNDGSVDISDVILTLRVALGLDPLNSCFS